MSAPGLVVDGVPVPIFVINLDSRTDRWSVMFERLEAHGLEAQRMPALTGAGATDLGYRTSVPRDEVPGWRMNPGALGCAASHLEVYRRVAGLDAPGALVLEDDVVFADGFVSRAQRALDTRSSRSALVSLGWTFYKPTARARAKDLTHRLTGRGLRDRLTVQTFGMGAFCYWVSREFASVAPELMTPIYAPLDAMLCAITRYSSWQSEVHWPPIAGVDDSPSDIR